MVINIDWFSFSVLLALSDEEKAHGISLRCPDGYQMVEYSGTNLYKNRYILYSQYGDKVLTLLTTPHSKIIKPESMFVEVANRWLYCDFSFECGLLWVDRHTDVDLVTEFQCRPDNLLVSDVEWVE